MFRQASWTRRRRISIIPSQRSNDKHGRRRRRRRVVVLTTVGVTTTTTLLVASYYTNLWRTKHLETLPDWQEEQPLHKDRTVDNLAETVQRAKLMGSVPMGVSQELDHIRKWHLQHNYKGGLVLRELNTPIFAASSHHNNDNDNDADATTSTTPKDDDNDDEKLDEHNHTMDAMSLARRECYYLYYEVKGNGQITQQIFCRGTTLTVDILTCLDFWWKYDEELQCRIHGGFLNHANHLLQDVMPLLAPPTDTRATIEISGHSLGGAVAMILAMKLKLLGYNVVQLTTVGAPRFCETFSSNSVVERRLVQLLPADTLRIQDDLDIVPFLPPFASHVGDKLWIVHEEPNNDNNNDNGTTRCLFVPFPHHPWTESTWINFRFFPILTNFAQHHRATNYIQELLRIKQSTIINDNDNEDDPPPRETKEGV